MKHVALGILLASILGLVGTGPEIQRACAESCIPIEALCLPVPDMPDHCWSPYAPGSPEALTIQKLWYTLCGGCPA